MNLFELAAKLTLDSSQYEEGLGNAEKNTRSFGSKVGGALKSLAKVGAVAMAAASAAVIKFGKDAIEAGAEFETSFAQLGTIMDETQKSAAEMKDGLMKLSSQMGISASELAETTYNAISATGDTAGALTIVENASKLAKAGFTDTASALSTLTTVMNSYGMTAEETVGISDSLVMVQNLGVTTVSELSAAMGKAIATASAYGVDLYNLESAYISLTKNGINTAESTTYISAMLNELGKDSSNVSKILKQQTGKSFAELMREGKSLGDVLGILSETVDGDSAALINLWGSAEAGKAASAIASQGLDQFNENLLAVANSAGATQTAFEKMQDTLSARIDKLKTSFNNLKIAVSENLTPSFGDFVDAATSGLQRITEAYQSGGLSAAIETLGDELGSLTTKLVEKLPDIVTTASTLLQSFGTALINNADVIANSIVGVVDALFDNVDGGANAEKIIDAAYKILTTLMTGLSKSLPKAMPKITEVIVGIVKGLTNPDNLKQLVNAAADLLVALANGLVESQGILIESLPEILENLGIAILENLPELSDTINSVLWTLLTGITEEETQKLRDAVFGWISDTITTIGELMKNFGKLVGDAWEAIKSFAVEKWSEIKDKIVEKWNEIKQKIHDKIEEIKTKISEKWDEIKTTVSEKVDKIKNDMQTKWDEIKQKITQPIENAKQAIESAFNNIKTTIMNVVNSALNWGSDLIENFKQGIKNKLSSLTSTVTSVASSIKSLLGFSEPETGPLSNFHTYAPDMMDLFIKGIRDNEQKLRDQIEETFDIHRDMNLTGDISGENGVYSLLAQYLPQLSKMTVVLDTGALVGAIAPEMDDALGARASFAARGVTA